MYGQLVPFLPVGKRFSIWVLGRISGQGSGTSSSKFEIYIMVSVSDSTVTERRSLRKNDLICVYSLSSLMFSLPVLKMILKKRKCYLVI